MSNEENCTVCGNFPPETYDICQNWQPISEYVENDHEIVMLELPDKTWRLCVFLEDVGFQVDGSQKLITNATHFFIPPTRKCYD